MRRHGAPGAVVGVVHAFLRLGVRLQNALGNDMAIPAVFRRRFADGGLVSRKVQIYDFVVFHGEDPPFLPSCGKAAARVTAFPLHPQRRMRAVRGYTEKENFANLF